MHTITPTCKHTRVCKNTSVLAPVRTHVCLNMCVQPCKGNTSRARSLLARTHTHVQTHACATTPNTFSGTHEHTRAAIYTRVHSCAKETHSGPRASLHTLTPTCKHTRVQQHLCSDSRKDSRVSKHACTAVQRKRIQGPEPPCTHSHPRANTHACATTPLCWHL